ncbi:MAG: epoxyqueuosine reductase QueH [Lachnospiraceae bacterium]|nr:epoxyqueuosine reductase QueH [Lachnospiraceae bacterium]
MNATNFQKELDKLIDRNAQENRVPTLLLHSCCAPCSSYVLEYLSKYFSITDFYYNPNISPEGEYRRRTDEMERFIKEFPVVHEVTFLEGNYDPERFFSEVKGLEQEPEGGERCKVCFRMRLEEAAKMAKELGMDYFATTLTISPMKNAALLNQIGEEVAEIYGVTYLPSDFKKKNGFKRSTELSKEYDLYRQDYCGCVFSKAERERQKREMEATR